ncbi:pyridoxamine 5'-phosphate oxidase family protein [Spongorhabdus nitratireducens]
MAKRFDALSDEHIEFIAAQKMFFVATAAATGTINLSPKGMDSLRVIDSNKVIWLNLTGSGNETATHLQQLPRMTLMFCAFEDKPEILRLYGQAEAIHQADPRWKEYQDLFPALPGIRQVIVMDIDLVQTSCGFSVPLYQYEGQREILTDWAERAGHKGMEEYWLKRNQQSLDGLETGIKTLSGL